jgi:hypothetical protein
MEEPTRSPSQTPSLNRTVLLIVIVIAFLIFVGLFTAQKNESAEQAIRNAEKVLSRASAMLKNLTSARLEMRLTVRTPKLTAIFTGEGVIKREETSYMTFNSGSQIVKVLTVSQTESYLKDPNTGVWKLLPQDDNFRYLGSSSIDFFTMYENMEPVKNIELEEDEAIDNHRCYHVRYEYDMLKAIDLYADPTLLKLLQENPDSLHEIEDMKLRYDLWIDQANYYTRQYMLTMKFPSPGLDAEGLMKASEFNEDVYIPSP